MYVSVSARVDRSVGRFFRPTSSHHHRWCRRLPHPCAPSISMAPFVHYLALTILVRAASAWNCQTDPNGCGYISYEWLHNGGTRPPCAWAVAIAIAESGGDCKATHNNGGSIDRGLWQINDVWHPEVSDDCAYDCACNAKSAVAISNGGSDWSPWSTYKSGAYKQYLSYGQQCCDNTAEAIRNSSKTVA